MSDSQESIRRFFDQYEVEDEDSLANDLLALVNSDQALPPG